MSSQRCHSWGWISDVCPSPSTLFCVSCSFGCAPEARGSPIVDHNLPSLRSLLTATGKKNIQTCSYDNVIVNVSQYFTLLFCATISTLVLPRRQAVRRNWGLHLAYVNNSSSFSLPCLKRAWWHQHQGPCPPPHSAMEFLCTDEQASLSWMITTRKTTEKMEETSCTLKEVAMYLKGNEIFTFKTGRQSYLTINTLTLFFFLYCFLIHASPPFIFPWALIWIFWTELLLLWTAVWFV